MRLMDQFDVAIFSNKAWLPWVLVAGGRESDAQRSAKIVFVALPFDLAMILLDLLWVLMVGWWA